MYGAYKSYLVQENLPVNINSLVTVKAEQFYQFRIRCQILMTD